MKQISLFNIPAYQIDTASYSNLLHDRKVRDFEEAFAKYVGAQYAVSFNSATSAIFLLLRQMFRNRNIYIKVPSLIPPVVLNAIINSGNHVYFDDNIEWIGNEYTMFDYTFWRIIDSAQRVTANQYRDLPDGKQKTFIVYSFYPTKPVGGADGGMIVSDNKGIMDELRTFSMNGMSGEANNWERTQTRVGHKMYMNSIQADIALRNLKKLDEKKANLGAIRAFYDGFLGGGTNPSDHLYRIEVSDQHDFINKAKEQGITCGIHYRAAHLNPLFEGYTKGDLPKSVAAANNFVSIPFHEALSPEDCERVLKFVKYNR
jgi:dTDP-4-amino-4,6-dideoxygalactose transaminase